MRHNLWLRLAGGLMIGMAGFATALAQQPGAIETADAEWSGVQTDLLEVKRMSDNTVRVRWRWRNGGEKEASVAASDSGNLLREQTYLLDPANKKKHFVVTDAKGNPIASNIPLGFRIRPKDSFSAWAKFPAPPPDVAKITVVIAKTPPFEDIAISK